MKRFTILPAELRQAHQAQICEMLGIARNAKKAQKIPDWAAKRLRDFVLWLLGDALSIASLGLGVRIQGHQPTGFTAPRTGVCASFVRQSLPALWLSHCATF